MRTAAISAVKNEEDIIELFVRHNLAFVDALIVLDNGSTDGTREILARLVREGLPLVVFDEPDPAYRQSAWMTRLLRNSVRFYAVDAVFPLDADEFLVSRSREDLHDAISAIPMRHVGRIPWRTYVWRPEDAGPDPIRAIRHRRIEERPVWHKVVIPVGMGSAWVEDLVIDQGSHTASLASEGDPVASVDLKHVTIAHFPVRSAEQIFLKALLGWLAYVARDGSTAAKKILAAIGARYSSVSGNRVGSTMQRHTASPTTTPRRVRWTKSFRQAAPSKIRSR